MQAIGQCQFSAVTAPLIPAAVSSDPSPSFWPHTLPEVRVPPNGMYIHNQSTAPGRANPGGHLKKVFRLHIICFQSANQTSKHKANRTERSPITCKVVSVLWLQTNRITSGGNSRSFPETRHRQTRNKVGGMTSILKLFFST